MDLTSASDEEVCDPVILQILELRQFFGQSLAMITKGK